MKQVLSIFCFSILFLLSGCLDESVSPKPTKQVMLLLSVDGPSSVIDVNYVDSKGTVTIVQLPAISQTMTLSGFLYPPQNWMYTGEYVVGSFVTMRLNIQPIKTGTKIYAAIWVAGDITKRDSLQIVSDLNPKQLTLNYQITN